MKNKTLCLFFINVENVHLGKDVFLTPYYLGKELGYNVKIVYPLTETNRTLEKYHRGVEFIPIEYHGNPVQGKWQRYSSFFKQWFKTIVKSDVLMLFHYYYNYVIYLGILYKLMHPKGKLYLKLDADIIALKKEDDYKNAIQKWYWNIIHSWFAKVVDCVTCETTIAYDFIMNTKATCYKFRDQMILMPNAFDGEFLQKHPIRIKSFKEKHKVFMTCGRIGTEQKNTEMLLNALSKVDLKDWKFKIIGPYPEEFQPTIDAFYKNNPEKSVAVEFVGNVSDKLNVYSYFNDCQVLIMTSRFESSALVFVEANMFRDYIISTNVGSFYDITQKEKYGCRIEQEDDQMLAEKIQAVVDGTLDINVYPDDYKGVLWEDVIKPVAEILRG